MTRSCGTSAARCARTASSIISASARLRSIRPDGSQRTVLTAADGLSNPSAVAIWGSTVYVLSAAYFTHNDPNVLLASLHR